MTLDQHRSLRLFPNDGHEVQDYRDEFQHDRDRIIHSTALRRLEEVSQVVSPVEGNAFHNRLTHTLKVAQVARRIAEKFIKQAQNDPELQLFIDKLGGLNAEAVEAAAFAHDLGHPPFGHLGEMVLDRLVRNEGNEDGFEGNAQSFRIVSKLATRDADLTGLNLTRATLRAVLKYPWHYDKDHKDKKRREKWGAYKTESFELSFAKDQHPTTIINSEVMSLEAAIMDLADDIAYATHDIEDFYRAGLIPLELLFAGLPRFPLSNEAERFLAKVEDDKKRDSDRTHRIFQERISLFFYGIDEPYRGTRAQKSTLRRVASIMIGSYVNKVEINPQVVLNPDQLLLKLDNTGDMLLEIKLLKDFTKYYVHRNRPLVTQQHGEQRIIENLFKFFLGAADPPRSDDEDRLSLSWFEILPKDYQELYDEEALRHPDMPSRHLHARIVSDVISQLTDNEAYKLHARLIGAGLGSIMDGYAD